MSIYYKDMELLHSFDAYYKNVILKNNTLIIPYINLGILDHPLNPDKKMQYINYTYAAYRDITYLSVFINKKTYGVIGSKKDETLYHAGGAYLDYNDFVFNDLEICCGDAFLQTLDFSKTSYDMWIPFDTANFPANMEAQVVNNFFGHNYLPGNLKELIM